MKRLTVATLVLSIGAVWLAACPLFLFLLVLPPSELLQDYQNAGVSLPSLSAPFVEHLSLPLLISVATAISVMLLLLEWRIQSERARFVGQITVIVGWQLLALIGLLGYSLASFKMGEVVTDEMRDVQNELRIRHKASQPTNAPYSQPAPQVESR